MAPELDPFFAELNSLIAEKMGEKAKAKEDRKTEEKVTKAKGRLGRGDYSQAKEDAELIARWEAEHIWRPTRRIALFEQQVCECGCTASPTFLGFYREDISRREPTTKRAVQMDRDELDQLTALPKTTMIETTEVVLCAECAGNWTGSLDPEVEDWPY